MAVVKSPLMSLDARGTVAHAVTFAKWKGRNYVRKTVKPANPKSGLQLGTRAMLRWNAQQYKNIGTTPQANWKALAKAKKITALNSMASMNGQRGRQDKPPLKDPQVTSGTAEAAPTVPAATGLPKSVKITWTDSVGAADWGTSIYMVDGAAVTTGPATLVQMVAHGIQVYTFPKLITGHTYHFKLRGFSTDGTYSVDTAEVTATVL